MVVEDEVVLGVTDTFVGEQGVGEEVAGFSVRLACAFLLSGAASILKSLQSPLCSRMIASLLMRSLKRKIIRQRSISEVQKHTLAFGSGGGVAQGVQ